MNLEYTFCQVSPCEIFLTVYSLLPLVKKLAKSQIQVEADNQICAVKKPRAGKDSSKKDLDSSEKSTVAKILFISLL